MDKIRATGSFSYWTLKDSYIKARGTSLSISHNAFWFELGGSSLILCVTGRCPDNPERWRFYQFSPTDEHVMPVAVAVPMGVEPSIHLRWLPAVDEPGSRHELSAARISFHGTRAAIA